MSADPKCNPWEKLVLPSGPDGWPKSKFRTEPQSLKSIAQISLTPGHLITFPELFGAQAGKLTEELFVWQLAKEGMLSVELTFLEPQVSNLRRRQSCSLIRLLELKAQDECLSFSDELRHEYGFIVTTTTDPSPTSGGSEVESLSYMDCTMERFLVTGTTSPASVIKAIEDEAFQWPLNPNCITGQLVAYAIDILWPSKQWEKYRNDCTNFENAYSFVSLILDKIKLELLVEQHLQRPQNYFLEWQ